MRYVSRGLAIGREGLGSPRSEIVAAGAASVAWWSSVHRQIYASPNGQSLKATRGDGSVVDAVLKSGAWSLVADDRTGALEHRDSITAITGGGWRYRDQSGMALESYDSAGLMTTWVQSSGMPLSATQTSGRLSKLADPFGRSIGFTYKSLATSSGAQVVIDSLRDPQGQILQFGYDELPGNLTSIRWPDNQVRTFVYDSPHPNQAWALTGIIDEAGKRYATFGYDAVGRAISTEHAGGVEKYSVTYPGGEGPKVVTTETYDSVAGVIRRYRDWSVDVPPVVTGPNGAVETFNPPDLTLKYPRDTGRTQPAGAGCAASSSKIEYDANGNKALEDDFNGNRTCFVSTGTNEGGAASVPNLLKVKVEGLVGTTGASAGSTPTACSSVTGDSVALPAGSRKTSTQWHPQWALKVKEAQPNLITTWVYNGQPDPFNGGATAYCVTAKYGSSDNQPKLPDGSDTAVLCKKVEQATTDATGEKGFAATLTTVGDVKQRQWTYTYNQYGQVLTSTDPMGQTTTYTYRCEGQATCDGTNKFVFTGTAPNEVGYYQGDLWKVTNAAGHVTEYVSYDRAGRVLEMKDANGLQTKLSYSPRGWVTEVNTAGLKTSYEYWPTGLLKKSTQPDGSYLYYRYDDAHRLTSVSDQVNADGNPTGNTVTYTLDNMGNRKTEQLNDATNAITRHIQRDYDALNRLKSISGGVQ